MKRVAIALAVSTSMIGTAYSQQQLVPGTWVTIYMNDFKSVNFNSLSKNRVCVSGAKEKAGEFQSKGMTLSAKVLMEEIAVFEATTATESFLIYCNQNGVLLVDMMVAGPTAEALNQNEAVGTETRSGDALDGTTRVETDKETGNTRTTTETPTK